MCAVLERVQSLVAPRFEMVKQRNQMVIPDFHLQAVEGWMRMNNLKRWIRVQEPACLSSAVTSVMLPLPFLLQFLLNSFITPAIEG